MGDHRGFLFMFSMRNHTRSCTYIAFFSNLLRAMFILQRTNFVSTKNIDNCVLLFLYVLPIDDQIYKYQRDVIGLLIILNE